MVKKILATILSLSILLMMYLPTMAADVPLSSSQTLVISKEVDEENAYILTALAERESSLRPWVANGDCIGLCQINPRWWQKEMNTLGITDLFDAKQSLTLANAILNSTNYPMEFKLMLYSMNRNTAFAMWNDGEVTNYAISIIQRADELHRADFIETVNAIAIESTSNQLMVMSNESYEICKPLDIRVLIDDELDLYEWELFTKWN